MLDSIPSSAGMITAIEKLSEMYEEIKKVADAKRKDKRLCNA